MESGVLTDTLKEITSLQKIKKIDTYQSSTALYDII
jgi:hypothetical protein